MASTTDVGSSSTPLEITIENTGEGMLDISEIEINGTSAAHFELDTAGTALSLGNMETTSFTLTFSPTNGGRKVAALNIASDDLDEPSYVVFVAAGSTSNRWRSLGNADGPVARYDAAMAEVDSNTAMLFGGRTADGTVLDDAWLYDVDDDIWTEISTAVEPSARFSHGLASVGGRRVALFGGLPSEGGMALGDMWIYDAVANSWTDAGPSAVPARSQHGFVGLTDTAIVYAGLTDGGVADTDQWLFDVDTMTWSSVSSATATPVYAAGIGYRGGVLTVAGGLDADGASMAGYDLSALSGSSFAHNNLLPQPRIDFELVYLSADIAIGFGGRDVEGGVGADTTYQYLFTPRTWSDLAPPSAPSARHSYCATALGSSRKMLVFGGRAGAGGSTVYGDVWEYVGSYD